MYQDFLAGAAARHEYWRQKCEAHRDFAAAEPNAGHRVLARSEERGLLWGVITQNIDGLHQIAGSQNVLELHGTNRAIDCLACRERFAIVQIAVRSITIQALPSASTQESGPVRCAD